MDTGQSIMEQHAKFVLESQTFRLVGRFKKCPDVLIGEKKHWASVKTCEEHDATLKSKRR